MEKAVLVGIYQKNREQCVSSLKELAFLVQTAGGEAEVTFIQHLDKIHPGTFIGKGKVAEIKEYLSAHKIDLVVFDDSLSPAQQSNLEDELEVTVLDRTAVILDIFAQNARTKEGALQVELAQLQYRLPRLKGSKQHLSRLGGGIGTRGPGETQLEVDRRRIRQRIDGICAELGRVKQHRKLHREKRRGVPLPVVALVGYTNAGKSTLLNTLCEANVVSAANRLFETLDPTTRRIELSNRQPVLITDTVGFIQKLPHELVESFKATLEEIGESDLILHIIDGSHPEFEKQAQTVLQVLDELGFSNKPVLHIYNKLDLFERQKAVFLTREKLFPSILISAHKKINMDQLYKKIEELLSAFVQIVSLHIPMTQVGYSFRASLLKQGTILNEKVVDETMQLEASIPPNLIQYIKKNHKEWISDKKSEERI